MPTRAQSLEQLERWLRAFYQVHFLFLFERNNAYVPQLSFLCSNTTHFPQLAQLSSGEYFVLELDSI